MKTIGKFSLFIALLALVVVLGCTKKKPLPPPSAEPVNAAETDPEEEEPGSVESRCFDGDPAACDELGH
ncbi:MAG: hypothetical protein WBG86_05220 [Polyangiales bacterium]